MEISSWFSTNLLEQTVSRLVGHQVVLKLRKSPCKPIFNLNRRHTWSQSQHRVQNKNSRPWSSGWGSQLDLNSCPALRSMSSSSPAAPWSITPAVVSDNLLVTRRLRESAGCSVLHSASAARVRPRICRAFIEMEKYFSMTSSVFNTLRCVHTMLNYEPDSCTDPSLWAERHGLGREDWISITRVWGAWIFMPGLGELGG